MSPILGIIASQDYVRIPPSSYESIATASGSGTTFTLSSIPSTYKSIQIRCLVKTNFTAAADVTGLRIRFNGDTGTNYAYHSLLGNGAAASSENATSTNEINIPICVGSAASVGSSTFGAAIIDIVDYASTTKYKTLRSFAGANANLANTQYKVALQSGLWMSTSALTSITFTNDNADSFVAGTTFALYGIKG